MGRSWNFRKLPVVQRASTVITVLCRIPKQRYVMNNKNCRAFVDGTFTSARQNIEREEFTPSIARKLKSIQERRSENFLQHGLPDSDEAHVVKGCLKICFPVSKISTAIIESTEHENELVEGKKIL